jgi:cytochrome c556
MKKNLWTPIVAIALAAGFVADATAQVNPNQLVVWRKAAMQMQGKTFFPIFGMTQAGATYDAAAAQRNADQLSVVTQLAWDTFQPTTAGNTNSRAKDEIYKDTAKFKERQDALHTNVQKLSAAVKAGDQAGVGAAAKNVARACNGCHEDFSTYQFRFKVE